MLKFYPLWKCPWYPMSPGFDGVGFFPGWSNSDRSGGYVDGFGKWTGGVDANYLPELLQKSLEVYGSQFLFGRIIYCTINLDLFSWWAFYGLYHSKSPSNSPPMWEKIWGHFFHPHFIQSQIQRKLIQGSGVKVWGDFPWMTLAWLINTLHRYSDIPIVCRAHSNPYNRNWFI